MRRSAAFLGKFCVLAAALFWLWSFGGFGDAYGRTVTAVANPLVWAMSGFRITDTSSTPRGLDVVISDGRRRLVMPFQPREMFSGLIPFLALLGASANLAPRRRLRACVIGVALLFAFHIGLMVLGPYMTGYPQATLGVTWMRRVNKLIDVIYAFYGLVGFAALPFLLWFWLTQRQSREATS